MTKKEIQAENQIRKWIKNSIKKVIKNKIIKITSYKNEENNPELFNHFCWNSNPTESQRRQRISSLLEFQKITKNLIMS